MDYVIGVLIFIFHLIYSYIVGEASFKDNHSMPFYVVYGYIVHSFFMALGLIVIQVLELAWIYACIYVVLIYLLLGIGSIYRIKKNDIKVLENTFSDFFKQYYFLFLITIVLMFLYLMQLDLIWINNHLDDGLYLVKAATLPYVETPFSISYATGLFENDPFSSYDLNVLEIECSVWIYLLKMDPSIFMRFALNAFHYFLMTCTTYLVCESISNDDKYKKYYQYTTLILLIFMFNDTCLAKGHILCVQDAWQFLGAMWYGSSIVRMMGLFWIIIPFMKKESLSIKDFLFVFIICVVLISKSSIALPLIIITGISYLIVFCSTLKNKKYLGISIGLIVISLIAGFLLKDISVREQSLISLFKQNCLMLLPTGSVLLILIGIFKNKSVSLIRYSSILICMLLFMVIPELNDMFENIAMYDFVAKRTQTTWFYSLAILATSSLVLLIVELKNKKFIIPLFYGMMCICIGIAMLSYYIAYHRNPLYSYVVLANNTSIFPETTKELSYSLQEMAQNDYDEFNVMVPEWVETDGNRHSLAVMIRTYAPDVNSISAIKRFPVKEGNDFSFFSEDDYYIYENFMLTANEENYQQLEKILMNYQIDCLVFYNDAFEKYASRCGYVLRDTTSMYRIYVKK